MENPIQTSFILSPALRERVCEQLGLAQPLPVNLAGLQTVYRAWCSSVPFDNVRKMIALRTEPARPLPGGEAEDFFTHWLADGAGGTCWPTSNALFTLLHSLGFAARRVAGSMHDLGIVNHGSVKVHVEGRNWLVDSSLLCGVPLPLEETIFANDDPVWAVEVEPTDGTYLIWFAPPNSPTYMRCRLLVDPADAALYQTRYEVSRTQSPFNDRMHARRNHPGELRLLIGNTKYVKTAAGVTLQTLTRAEICQSLHEDIGLSETLIAQWVQSGSLEASFVPASQSAPPRTDSRPPSQR
ncbi:MAG: arylamine N-acetyltransferase [Blastocatellia bacterium]